jgi:hypothetical protein
MLNVLDKTNDTYYWSHPSSFQGVEERRQLPSNNGKQQQTTSAFFGTSAPQTYVHRSSLMFYGNAVAPISGYRVSCGKNLKNCLVSDPLRHNNNNKTRNSIFR